MSIQSTKHHDVSLNSQNLYLDTPWKFEKKSNKFYKNERYISIFSTGYFHMFLINSQFRVCDIEIFSYHTLMYIFINYASLSELISTPKNEIENVYCIECQVNRINYSHPPDFLLNDTSRIH